MGEGDGGSGGCRGPGLGAVKDVVLKLFVLVAEYSEFFLQRRELVVLGFEKPSESSDNLRVGVVEVVAFVQHGVNICVGRGDDLVDVGQEVFDGL